MMVIFNNTIALLSGNTRVHGVHVDSLFEAKPFQEVCPSRASQNVILTKT